MLFRSLDNAIGSSDAASQGVIDAVVLRTFPSVRAAQTLEWVPGLAVTQHSGEGKATQWLLRGMNLDHGTDFALSINGVPINLPTHAHGQGYADVNPLIPELIERIEYRKGPYFAQQGDFSSAGSADIVYRTQLERPLYAWSLGPQGHLRVLGAESKTLAQGVTLLGAVERLNQDGPWRVREGLRKSNAQLILSDDTPRQGWRLSLSAYAAHGQATDQVPQRLLDAGQYLGQAFGRFDSLDPSDGGTTARVNLSGLWHQASDHQLTRVEWYVLRNQLNLYSNFTYALQPNGDQFGQTEHRWAGGGRLSRTWLMDHDLGPEVIHTLGLQWRQDQMRLGLMDTTSRQTRAWVRDDQVQLAQVALYGESEWRWHPWLKTVAGLRLDQLHARVNSLMQADNSGSAHGAKLAPKLSWVLGPWRDSELFFNLGQGFHSNDARGMTTRVDPRTANPVAVSSVLANSWGRELGLKSNVNQHLQTRVALWQLNFDSEQVYANDTGGTLAGRPSHRHGVEWGTQWAPTAHVAVSADLAWSHAGFANDSPAGAAVPQAAPKMARVQGMLNDLQGWSAGLGLRHVAARPLLSDRSAWAPSSTTLDLRVLRQVSDAWEWGVEVLNLTDRKNIDAAYAYVSRLAGEPLGGISDVHLHPAWPRTWRLLMAWRP